MLTTNSKVLTPEFQLLAPGSWILAPDYCCICIS
jgi:hypothetical protein